MASGAYRTLPRSDTAKKSELKRGSDEFRGIVTARESEVPLREARN